MALACALHTSGLQRANILPRRPLFRQALKEYSDEASYSVILRYIERYHFLRDLGVSEIDLGSVSLPMIRYLAHQAKHYDVHTLQRFPETKRYGLTACFPVEIHKTILDHIVALHDQLLTKKMREARNVFEKRYRQVRRKSRRGSAKLISTGETLLDPERAPETTLAELLQELDEESLRDAVKVCSDRQYLEERGEIDAFRARYPRSQTVFPRVFRLTLPK